MKNQLTAEHILFFGRTYEDILSVFALTEDDLKDRSILDCNSGPDAFVGEAAKRGFDIRGCDPLYAKPLEEIVAQGKADIEDIHAKLHSQGERNQSLDPEAFIQSKHEALGAFAQDFAAAQGSGRYVAGALPELPFDDQSIDLVLSAHFLFVGSHPRFGGMIETEQFDEAFHHRAVRELLRVARQEVRLFPFTKSSQPNILHPWAAQIIGDLAKEGHEIAIIENDYNQGAYTDNHVLVIRPR